MYRFLLSHPRWVSLSIVLLGLLLNLVNGCPRLHNDDIQQFFTICNGGVDAPTCFALYSSTVYGWLLKSLLGVFPEVNVYLAILCLVIPVSLAVINGFVLKSRADAGEGSLSRIIYAISVLFLIYFNKECWADQHVHYTHVSLLAGAACCTLLFQAMCGHAGKKRMLLCLLLFVLMFILRKEAILSFFFMAGGVALAAFLKAGLPCVWRSSWKFLLCMLSVLAVCELCDRAGYGAFPEWDEALTYRKWRVNIQDCPDNSGLDKTEALLAAGIEPEEFDAFKSFIYTPTMDDMVKIREARRIHMHGRVGFLGSDLAAEHGLLQADKGKLTALPKDFVAITPWFALAGVLGLFLLSFNGRTARVFLPVFALFLAYAAVLFLARRCEPRVVDPAIFLTSAWGLAFLPSDSWVGRAWLTRWGVLGAELLCLLFCMRHYRAHFDGGEKATAAQYCQEHSGNLYLSMTMQACPIYSSGVSGCTPRYWATTNVVPVGDAWIFYTPAYRAFLRARGIGNPYLLAARDNVFFAVKDTGEGLPPCLARVSALYHCYTGKHLMFHRHREFSSLSLWKAEEVEPGDMVRESE